MLIYKGKLSIELEEDVEKLKIQIRTTRKIKRGDYVLICLSLIRWKNTNDGRK